MFHSARFYVFWAVCIVVAASGLQGKAVTTDMYSYRETLGKKTTFFSWKLEAEGQKNIVTVHQGERSSINICSADGATLQWQLKDPDEKNEIVATRHGNELKISGLRNGSPYEQMVDLQDRPWYQPLSYSLREFLDSDNEAISFWTVRADTFETIALRAVKKGEEDIMVGGKKEEALKVEVRAEGFYSSFWHGNYWYRKSDKLFLMYRSVHGLPGSAETIVELNREPEGSNIFLQQTSTNGHG